MLGILIIAAIACGGAGGVMLFAFDAYHKGNIKLAWMRATSAFFLAFGLVYLGISLSMAQLGTQLEAAAQQQQFEQNLDR